MEQSLHCISKGTSSASIQLGISGLNIEAGKTYTLTLAVTTSWQTFTYTFKANASDADSRLNFHLGNSLPAGAQLNVDSFSLGEVL